VADLTRINPQNFVLGGTNVEQALNNDDADIKKMYQDITKIRKRYKGPVPPSSPNVGDEWKDDSVTPSVIKEWNGSIWETFIASPLSKTGDTMTGVLNEALGTAIASASTINLTTATGNFLHITGTTAITAVTLGAGMRREVIFDEILTLTHHATNNNLPGAANIITAAGDRASYYSDGTTVYCTKYQRADGTAISEKVSIQGSFKNLKIQVISNTQATITADQIVLFDDFNNAKLISAVSATLDKTILGAVTGLDTGTIANSTWYYVWAIAKPDGTKGVLMSLSATAPTMPSGYTFKARIGAIKTHSDGTLLRTLQYGRNIQYINSGSLPLIASGTQGTSPSTYVTASTTSAVPPTACRISISAVATAQGAVLAIAPNGNYGAYNTTSNPPPFILSMDNDAGWGFNTCSGDMMLESTNIYLISTSTTGKVFCLGWEDNL